MVAHKKNRQTAIATPNNLIDQVVIALQYKTDRMQTRPHIQFNRGAMRERSYPQKNKIAHTKWPAFKPN